MDLAVPTETNGQRFSRLGLAALLLGAGTMHFVGPEAFDELVPEWLPGSQRAWTNVSGVAELAVGALVVRRSTSRLGGWAAFGLFVAVFPGNVWDAIQHPPTDGEGVARLVRLPLQIPLLVWSARIARRGPRPEPRHV